MKILVGIQGTGNGHLSRCHALAEVLNKDSRVEVDYLVSGRAQEKLFDMESFGNYAWRAGLSFQVRDGRVSLFDTLSQNPWLQFWDDVRSLDLSPYDLVVTDFEPVTAWAARRQGVRCIGMGRQYAFFKSLSDVHINPLNRAMLKQFAPCDTVLGMHWQNSGDHVIPPLIHGAQHVQPGSGQEVLVYLPFEPIEQVTQLFKHFPEYQFKVYHPDAVPGVIGNVECFKPSRTTFPIHFAQASGVISNAGFETSSEALARGKKLLVKPLHGQFEQMANARCLVERQLGSRMVELSPGAIEDWLEDSKAVRIEWPDVAPIITDWLANGALESVRSLNHRLWRVSEIRRAVA
ncbi:glycosyltransferase family protein [Aliidiomarina celeris]|uniref:glycosyltransferase family protein n=1 Tax=Aliidiomarina celeris TaxID=2249428 RepID=UPI000DEBF9C3|nr:glycosyltransferase family protein [Aliidiomarina celeris]